MGLFEMFWELDQRRRIRQLESQHEAMSRSGQDGRRQDTALEDRLERLSLVCHAMWGLLQNKCGVTDAELEREMLRLDLADGKQDGKHAAPLLNCSECTRQNNPTRRACLFCGAQLKPLLPFQGI